MIMRAINKIITRILPLVALLLTCGASVAAQNSPQISKVEPPNWWAGHTINPVRLLVRGRNLAGARVEAAGGKIVKPAFSFPGGRRFQFLDPDGYELAVWSDK